MVKQVKITGGMRKTWKSTILGDRKQRAAARKAGDEVLALANRKAASEKKSGFRFHYESRTLSGKWGDRVVIWPTSEIARSKPEILRRAAAGKGLRGK
jgi:hypothetical protein